MSYQPQTEAATSRFLNVEEAGKTLRIHLNFQRVLPPT